MTHWTSVVSYHTDPEVCGVAKFSKQLAARLGVPLVGLSPMVEAQLAPAPLFSIKWAEIDPQEIRTPWFQRQLLGTDQLWHDEPPPTAPSPGRVWKLYEIGVPALVTPSRITDAGILARTEALFTFGMAHKLDHEHFGALAALLPGFELWISTAAHEGAGPSRVPDLMQRWGPRARNLGHLTDDALGLVWPRVMACVAFFEHGLRPNNSSVHAALNAGVPVITNWGPGTPDDLKAITHDVSNLLPSLEAVLDATPHNWPPPSPYTWDRLLKELGCEPSR